MRSYCLFGAAVGVLLASPARADEGQNEQELRREIEMLRAEVAELRASVEKGQAEPVTGSTLAAQPVKPADPPAGAPPPVALAPPSPRGDQTGGGNHAFDVKGVTITPGGFFELAGIYRRHFEGSDISSSYAIPFPNNRASHAAEGRFSARQSRFSILSQAAASPGVALSGFLEIDFQGGARTANSNESNSFNPRMRNLYGTIDWQRGNGGLHVLAGQSWSLVTMTSKGLMPRKEVAPPSIDGQFIPGFVWARQPGVRLSGDFLDHKLWVGLAAENPQTTFASSPPPGVTASTPGGAGFDPGIGLSLSHVPDLIGKVAYDDAIGGHMLHVEAFGLVRRFDAHFDAVGNDGATGYGYGGGAMVQLVPDLLDARVSAMAGRGIGRYGTAGLPDVAFSDDGHIRPVREFMLLGGLTLHATRRLDIYAFAGEEQQRRGSDGAIGLPTADNRGCLVEGGICEGNTRRIRQITAGMWDNVYDGSAGRVQIGVQYSYTQRLLFAGLGGAPQASQDMALVSLRYFPF